MCVWGCVGETTILRSSSDSWFLLIFLSTAPLTTHTHTHTVERQWTYQTCTEFGYFQTTDSDETSLFSDGIGLGYYTDMCNRVFDIGVMAVYAAVNRTNQYYGGRNVTGTNIVFPNGSIDPWHALSVLTDIGSSVHAVYITGTAHCANMYPPRDSDPPGLTAARVEISTLIGTWLGES